MRRAARRFCCGSGCSALRLDRRGAKYCRERASSIWSPIEAGQPLRSSFPASLRIFRLLRRRFAPRRAQRRRCRRARRGDPDADALRARRARRCLAADSQRARPARRRHRAGAGQCRRRRGSKRVAETVLRQARRAHLRLDKGSHIVVRRLYDHDRAYILQAADRRIVFAIPYRATISPSSAPPIRRSPATRRRSRRPRRKSSYLCGVVNEYFRTAIDRRRCGVGVCRRARAL